MSASLPFTHQAVRTWFEGSFDAPTEAQHKAWPFIVRGTSTLLLAPTGSGKTLAAFLAAIEKLMFLEEEPAPKTRVLYISPLKALAVDVERNLRSPIIGINAVAQHEAATRSGHCALRLPTIGIRTGDTPSKERARLIKKPPDILITTPESFYLMLTSSGQKTLTEVETVIIDEIHSVASTKRGTHLFLSLERLEALRQDGMPPLQRIGLSATQRPLDEIARLLGGGTVEVGHGDEARHEDHWQQRPVEIVDVGARKSVEITVEVPVEDMKALQLPPDDDDISGPAGSDPSQPSIWPAIHPRLVELIRQHRSTMIFSNSRRLAERLAAAINETAEEELALAHHGSIAHKKRAEIEDRLKRGELPAIVATSSLELGIDMGAVDLVIQIEAPPSIASGLQRVGRAGHQVGATSKGIFFPKYRGDLLASAAATRHMSDAVVEETYYPRNPLDVLAQQIVAMVSMEDLTVDELFRRVRSAAPFRDLMRSSFENVLDMLSGRYPSDEFADLRARITWDRVNNTLTPRKGAQRIAIVSGGTIPDRGLYGVFLAAGDETKRSRRVGELDEEMVFESRPGEVFLLGASSWRIEEITHDRVLVSPAPGEPGKMPFWRGERPGRPVDFGRAIGSLARTLAAKDNKEAIALLREQHGLDDWAANNLLTYLKDQAEVTVEVPSDRTLIVERFLDEVGDYRVCLHSPFGARVHAPWAIAVMAKIKQTTSAEVDMLWSDDGIVFRLPYIESLPPISARDDRALRLPDDAPSADWFIPSSSEVEDLVVGELGNTSLFAAHFRENASRALLLPRRLPGKRTPLWAQRRKSASLLSVAAQYRNFPIVLETYRQCLRDVFDLPALITLLRQVETRKIRVNTVDTNLPSPFASSLLFSYVANFLYEGDAPLAERRAHALSIDHTQLKELLGDAELREMLDGDAIETLELRLQKLEPQARLDHIDAIHDLLLHLGDLTHDELILRGAPKEELQHWLNDLQETRRVIRLSIPKGRSRGTLRSCVATLPHTRDLDGEARFAAAEDAGRFRDALGVVVPPGLPEAFLESVADPMVDLVSRFARTHGPFTEQTVADRFGCGVAAVREALMRLASKDRVQEGAFLPVARAGELSDAGVRGIEWCDASVLRQIKRLSLAKLRREVEPVEQEVFARFLPAWHGCDNPAVGLDALLNTIEQLEGCPIPASVLEREVLPTRIRDYRPAQLDELCAAGEVIWRGVDPIGTHDGRVALYLTDHFEQLAPPAEAIEGELEQRIHDAMSERGALFFSDLVRQTGSFPPDVLNALWALVWAGWVTNDALVPLRSILRGKSKARRTRSFRSRRSALPGSEGRWSLLPERTVTETERQTTLVRQLLERYGVLTREAVAGERVSGGFATAYQVLKAMEDTGRVRRGYFVAGLGATQFTLPGAEDRLRSYRSKEEEGPTILAATDPANAYGTILPWPDHPGSARPQRVPGALVILKAGRLLGYLGRTERSLMTFLAEDPRERQEQLDLLASSLAELVHRGGRRSILMETIDGADPALSPLATILHTKGFMRSSAGLIIRRRQTAEIKHI